MVIPTIIILRIWLKFRPLVVAAIVAAMFMLCSEMLVEHWQKQIMETLVGVGVVAGEVQPREHWQSVGR